MNTPHKVDWQELPFAVDPKTGEGARDTYWVNPKGEIEYVRHASGYNWKDEAQLVSRGPWLRVTDDSMDFILDREREEVEDAYRIQREAQQQLQDMENGLRRLLGDL